MTPTDSGQLGLKSVADLFLHLAQDRESGVLRFSHGRVIKAVFFELGIPTFAISSEPDEQLETVLSEDCFVPPDVMEKARALAASPQAIGKALVEMGALPYQVLRRTVLDLSARIILSLFEWGTGDFVFDHKVAVSHETKLEWTAFDCIVRGSRQAARIQSILNARAPADACVVRARTTDASTAALQKLNASESYVYSSIVAPVPISQIAEITALPDMEIRRAIAVARALGLLEIVGERQPASAPADAVGSRPGKESSAPLEAPPEAPPEARTNATEAAPSAVSHDDVSQHHLPDAPRLGDRVGYSTDPVEVLTGTSQTRAPDSRAPSLATSPSDEVPRDAVDVPPESARAAKPFSNSGRIEAAIAGYALAEAAVAHVNSEIVAGGVVDANTDANPEDDIVILAAVDAEAEGSLPDLFTEPLKEAGKGVDAQAVEEAIAEAVVRAEAVFSTDEDEIEIEIETSIDADPDEVFWTASTEIESGQEASSVETGNESSSESALQRESSEASRDSSILSSTFASDHSFDSGHPAEADLFLNTGPDPFVSSSMGNESSFSEATDRAVEAIGPWSETESTVAEIGLSDDLSRFEEIALSDDLAKFEELALSDDLAKFEDLALSDDLAKFEELSLSDDLSKFEDLALSDDLAKFEELAHEEQDISTPVNAPESLATIPAADPEFPIEGVNQNTPGNAVKQDSSGNLVSSPRSPRPTMLIRVAGGKKERVSAPEKVSVDGLPTPPPPAATPAKRAGGHRVQYSRSSSGSRESASTQRSSSSAIATPSPVPPPADKQPTVPPPAPKEISGVGRHRSSASQRKTSSAPASRKSDPPLSSSARPASKVEPRAEVAPGGESSRILVRVSKTASLGGSDSLERVVKEIEGKLKGLATANYYEVLGVDPLASTGRIDKAYRALEQMLTGYRDRWPSNQTLNAKLDLLMEKVSRAHDVLSNIEQRRLYDQPAQPKVDRGPMADFAPTSQTAQGPSSGPFASSAFPAPRAPQPASPAPGPAGSPPRVGAKSPGDSSGPVPIAPAGTRQRAEQLAASNFRQGMALYERHDLHTAVHMFREAVKLEPSNALYHYYLGLTLSILSQARIAHNHSGGCHVSCKMGGTLARNQRVRHEAVQHLVKAAELDPYNPQIRERLALLYQDAGMPKKAEQYSQEAGMLTGNSPEASLEDGVEVEFLSDSSGKPIKKTRRIRS